MTLSNAEANISKRTLLHTAPPSIFKLCSCFFNQSVCMRTLSFCPQSGRPSVGWTRFSSICLRRANNCELVIKSLQLGSAVLTYGLLIRGRAPDGATRDTVGFVYTWSIFLRTFKSASLWNAGVSEWVALVASGLSHDLRM